MLPYTYFLVEKIERSQNYDEVWLTEMPTPTFLKKVFILWVDDMPSNNVYYIERVVEKGMEVMQLTST